MFTIEHEFDGTTITLIDEPEDATSPLAEDVTIRAFDDRVVISQEAEDGEVVRIVLSLVQLRELKAALDLPEGSYRLDPRR